MDTYTLRDVKNVRFGAEETVISRTIVLSESLGVSNRTDSYWDTLVHVDPVKRLAVAEYGYGLDFYTWSYTAMLCLPNIPYEISDFDHLLDLMPKPWNFFSETFTSGHLLGKDGVTGRECNFLWVNSPVTVIDPQVDWKTTLKAKRRYEVRKALSMYPKGEVTIGVPQGVVDRVLVWLADKWGEDDREFAQLSFVYALSTPGTHFVTLPDLSALGWFLPSGSRNSYLFGGIAYAKPLESIGTYMLATFIEHVSSWGIHAIVDPTCKVSFQDSSIDIYKRHVVNCNKQNPMLAIKNSEEDEPEPPYYHRGSWVSSATRLVIGDEL